MKPRRLAFWLLCMDVTCAVFGFGSRPYLFCVARASDCGAWTWELSA